MLTHVTKIELKLKQGRQNYRVSRLSFRDRAMLKLILLSSLIIFSSSAFSDDHEMVGPYYAFYHFAAPDPAAVVAAMDKFWASDCGKKYPADAGLSQEVFNGGYQSTHFIINTFRNAKDQQEAAEILRSCPSAIAFLNEMTAAGVVPVSQYIGMAPIDENDWGQDSVFTKWDLVVEPQNQVEYAAAFANMTSALSENTDIRSYGLGSIGYGRDKFTNWVWFGAESIVEMDKINGQMRGHPAVIEFNRTAGPMREVVNTTLVQMLKLYPRNN